MCGVRMIEGQRLNLPEWPFMRAAGPDQPEKGEWECIHRVCYVSPMNLRMPWNDDVGAKKSSIKANSNGAKGIGRGVGIEPGSSSRGAHRRSGVTSARSAGRRCPFRRSWGPKGSSSPGRSRRVPGGRRGRPGKKRLERKLMLRDEINIKTDLSKFLQKKIKKMGTQYEKNWIQKSSMNLFLMQRFLRIEEPI